MKREVKHKYSETKEYAKAVVLEPMPREVFVKHLRDGIEEVYSKRRNIFNNYLTSLKILESYLIKYNINQIIPDEDFFEEIWDRLLKDTRFNARDYSLASLKKVSRQTREIVNRYFYQKGFTQRIVYTKNVRERFKRFLTLTKNSQEAIEWFEANGKYVENKQVYVPIDNNSNGNEVIKIIHRVTRRELKDKTRDEKIHHAMRFLNIVDKNGFEQATEEDVKKFEDYCDKNITQKEDYLAHTATFFSNIQSEGLIKHNPFTNISLKMNGGSVRKDFIPPEGIEKLIDLSTVNYKDKIDVRDRLVALLGYDLALRINEILFLRISDIQKDADGEWKIVMRSDIQKGDKDEVVMYFFFNETKKLLEKYLNKVRKEFNPTTDYLIVSKQGGDLCDQQYRRGFQKICDKLGIKTFSYKSPTPHHLRHSFATLNIDPLGINLSLYEVSKRLRHSRVETTTNHYVHNNPYLTKLKHKSQCKTIKKKTNIDLLNEIPLADIEHWLLDCLNVDATMIKLIRQKHKKMISYFNVDKQAEDNGKYITEEEALSRLKHLGITSRPLRNYAINKNLLAGGQVGTSKYGADFRYLEEFIEDLVSNYVSLQNLQDKMNLNLRSLQRVIKKEGWKVLRIGRFSFVRKQDCL